MGYSKRPPVKLKNHVVFVLDESSSMEHLKSAVVRVFRDQVKFLAEISQEMDQETRVSIWTFSHASEIHCLVHDVDVLRLPDIEEYYHPNGWTALLDATGKALDDIALIPQHRGDHAVLLFVITDGEENSSRYTSAALLKQRLAGLPENVSPIFLVPNETGRNAAERCGVPKGNIAIWETTAKGIEKASTQVKAATTAFYQTRATRGTGTKGTNTFFSMTPDKVNAATIAAAGLVPLDYGTYTLHIVPNIPAKTEIRNYINDPVSGIGRKFVLGRNFYELSKREEIQANKDIAVWEIATDRVYVGRDARKLVGLPDHTVRVSPEDNPLYKILIRSDSVNRHLVPFKRILIIH
jgi:hypothetical protein